MHRSPQPRTPAPAALRPSMTPSYSSFPACPIRGRHGRACPATLPISPTDDPPLPFAPVLLSPFHSATLSFCSSAFLSFCFYAYLPSCFYVFLLSCLSSLLALYHPSFLAVFVDVFHGVLLSLWKDSGMSSIPPSFLFCFLSGWMSFILAVCMIKPGGITIKRIPLCSRHGFAHPVPPPNAPHAIFSEKTMWGPDPDHIPPSPSHGYHSGPILP